MTSDFQVGKVGQAASDFTKQTYVVKYLIRVGKAELLQEGILFGTQFPSLGIFIYRKVGFRKK